jgi:preprotein translocase subunit SecG
VVLLQRGKGAEIGSVFGSGASTTVFGGRGAGNFLTKLTTGSAIVFMLTSLTLSYLGASQRSERLFEDGVPVEESAAPALPEPEPLATVELPAEPGAGAEAEPAPEAPALEAPPAAEPGGEAAPAGAP